MRAVTFRFPQQPFEQNIGCQLESEKFVHTLLEAKV